MTDRYLKKDGTREVLIFTELLNKRPDMIEISEKEAKALMSGKVEEPEDNDISVAARMTLIKEAIGELDPIDGWTKGGKDNEGSVPNCIALSAALGFDVKAKERDIVLAEMEG
jgi:hypothetical protein